MSMGYAFQFQDLTVLLGLDLGDPDDHADIDAISEILARRRATSSEPRGDRQRRSRHRTPLHLVPSPPS